ncbi:FecCD family ABC transporter permease [Bacillus horti]|uniref:Iron complex transport system permease protein n=1 Tax=Caldalkalibacillus horti TaxID=77523 RepID=A0ABT9VVW2_9BACI|nr:iron ABC transporter permease [Bacillus horti]MDQ0164972.1 iron complex transport system permease protein [Bacillus horti]
MSKRSNKQTDNLEQNNIRSKPSLAIFILFVGLLALSVSIAASVSMGVSDISLKTVWKAVFEFNDELLEHRVIHELRLPRALIGALVGAALAVSGALMQGMTRNPIASPGIMGLNAGSAFVLAVAFAFFPGLPYSSLIMWSFFGAALGAGITYGVSSFSKAGLTPIRLALAGTVVGALLSSASTGIAIYFNVAQDLTFWYAGGIVGSTWINVLVLVPWIAIGLVAALLLAKSITVLGLGEDTAIALGQRIKLVKIGGILIVILLAGAAVSAAGPVGFVGLIIPHITRFLVGVDYRWIIPCSAIIGALFLVLADIGSRLVNAPYETPIGVITAIVGVPFFFYLVRRDRRGM